MNASKIAIILSSHYIKLQQKTKHKTTHKNATAGLFEQTTFGILEFEVIRKVKKLEISMD